LPSRRDLLRGQINIFLKVAIVICTIANAPSLAGFIVDLIPNVIVNHRHDAHNRSRQILLQNRQRRVEIGGILRRFMNGLKVH
jgi:hypothetical protein